MAASQDVVGPAATGIDDATPAAAPARGSRLRDDLTAYAFLAPYLALFAVFVVAPAAYGLWVSLHDWEFAFPVQPFVGLDNYIRLVTPGSMTSGPFWRSMQATGTFTVLSVPILLVVPFAVALMLNLGIRARTAFRAVFFAPYALGVAVVSILWRFVADPNIGALNYLMGLVGLPADLPWTTQLPWAWVLLVGMTVWWTLGFNAVIYLAGLQEIPRVLYEAAEVDGASAWQRFTHVTLPGMRRVLVFVVTVTVLASANMFGQSYLVTMGGPGTATRTAIAYIAQEGIASYRMGNAAAMSFVLAAFLAATSVVVLAVFRRMED